MKKQYVLIFLTVLLGLHLSSLDILGQSCSQLSLPENAIARLCIPDGGDAIDLDYSPDGKTLASVLRWPRQIILWDVENAKEKLTINDVTGRWYSSKKKQIFAFQSGVETLRKEYSTLVCGFNKMLYYDPKACL